jgi:hypothetical protein
MGFSIWPLQQEKKSHQKSAANELFAKFRRQSLKTIGKKGKIFHHGKPCTGSSTG